MESINASIKGVSVNIVVKATAGLLLVILVPVEVLLQNSFQYYGGEAISYMQTHWHSQQAGNFFHALNYAGDSLALLLLTALLYHMLEPVKAIKFCVVSCTGMYLACLINMLYAEPRPYWVYGHIHARFCERSYATPSYLLTVVQISAGYIAVEYPLARVEKWIYGVSVGVLGGLLYYGQLYMGDLFPHQIVITLVYTYVYVTACFMADTSIQQIIRRSCFNYRKNRAHIVHWYLATIAMLLGAITIYDEVTLARDVNIFWIKHATVSSKQADCNFKYEVGASYSFFNSAFIFFQLGLVTGSMYLHKYFHVSWWRTPMWKRVIRAGLAMGMILGLKYLFDTLPSDDDTTEYTFNYVLPYYFSGSLITLPLVFVGSYTGLVSRQYRLL